MLFCKQIGKYVIILQWSCFAAQQAAEKAVKALFQKLLSVYLCGSWARGNYTPYSDIDLLILVTNDARKPWERVPDYLPGKFPVGLDLFVYTPGELQNSRFARELLKNAIQL